MTQRGRSDDAARPAGGRRATSPAEVTVEDGVARVVVHGDFDVDSSPEVVDAAVTVLGRSDFTRLVVDMSAAGFVDSTGLGSLIRLRLEARRHGAGTQLVGLDHRLLKLLRLTGLDRDFEA